MYKEKMTKRQVRVFHLLQSGKYSVMQIATSFSSATQEALSAIRGRWALRSKTNGLTPKAVTVVTSVIG